LDYTAAKISGVEIYSTWLADQYAMDTGTSMATPMVSGLASLMKSLNRQLTNEEIVDIIERTATHLGPGVGRNDLYGYGRINGRGALRLSQPCKVDFAHDYILSGEDWIKFRALFEQRDLKADLNDDHKLDVMDFIEFREAYQAGCYFE
jgi:hypothetical protein